MLGAGDAVEIVIDRVPEDLAQALVNRGATFEAHAEGVRLRVPAKEKRDVVEALWASGCDVIRINPVRDSLESLFLKLVEGKEAKA
jgi:hypothetical protein